VCFKKALKEKCVPNQPTATASSGPSAIGASVADVAASAAAGIIAEQLSSSSSVLTSSSSSGGLEAHPQSKTSSSDAVSSSTISDAPQSVPVPADPQTPEEEERKPTKVKNRCDSCKKKVGLTGFDCRCGGLYCAIHRYSDKHDCSYNYREQGAAEIRRNNPQIMGQKINKI